jgi:hypothetical protein
MYIHQAAPKPSSMAMVADHFTHTGTPCAASSRVSLTTSEPWQEVLDVLGVAEEQIVEHHARQHRAGCQHIERHQHHLRALVRIVIGAAMVLIVVGVVGMMRRGHGRDHCLARLPWKVRWIRRHE